MCLSIIIVSMSDRSRIFNVEAIVLRHRDWGEADRIITVYAREIGKTRVVVKGARKIMSRKAGHVEPFSLVKMQLSQTNDLPILTQVDTIRSNQGLRDNLEAISAASYLAELVDKFTQDEQDGESALFKLIADSFDRLGKPNQVWFATRFFETRMLGLAGYQPEFFQCVECHSQIIEEDQYFAPAMGGVVCARCGSYKPGMWKLSAKTLKYLRHFQRAPFSEYAKAKLDEKERLAVETFFQNYFRYLLERNLNTPDFIRSIK